MILIFLYCLCRLTIIKPQPALTSIQRTPLFKGHLPWSLGCPLNRGSLFKSSALTAQPLYLCIELTPPSLASSHNHIVSYIPVGFAMYFFVTRTYITEKLKKNVLSLLSFSVPPWSFWPDFGSRLLFHLGVYILDIFCLHTSFYFTLWMNPPSPSLFVTLKVCLSCLGSLIYVKLSAITRAVIKSQGLGISSVFYERGPWLVALVNRRKIEPKEIPSCFIPHLLVVFNRQLEILVTSLNNHEFC